MAAVQEAEAAKKAAEAAANQVEKPTADATVPAAAETATVPEVPLEPHPSEVIPAVSEEAH